MPSASSPRSVDGPSARTSPFLILAGRHQRLLVDAAVLVGPLEQQPVDLRLAFFAALYSTVMAVASTSTTVPSSSARIMSAASRAASMPVPMYGASADQRHGLLLHVGAHERPVGVVVLEERDQGRADRDDLLRRHVHELDLGGRHRGDLGGGREVDVARAGAEVLGEEACGDWRARTRSSRQAPVLGIDRRVGLGDDVELLLVGGQPLDAVTLPFMTLRYGDSMKPNGLTRRRWPGRR